jgi:hypothetical protein
MHSGCSTVSSLPELQLNSENFKDVQDEDNFTSPISRVPDSKRGTVCYLDEPLPLNLPPY